MVGNILLYDVRQVLIIEIDLDNGAALKRIALPSEGEIEMALKQLDVISLHEHLFSLVFLQQIYYRFVGNLFGRQLCLLEFYDRKHCDQHQARKIK